MEQRNNQSSSKLPWIVLGLVVIVIVVAIIAFKDKFNSKNTVSSPKSSVNVKASDWYSIFLTNGQVYFGKLSNADSQFMTLDDVYYLQVGPQQGSGAQQGSQPNISLVELGGELHGPTKQMQINSDHVLFFEQMKADAKVVQAIDSYKKQGSNPAAPSQIPGQ